MANTTDMLLCCFDEDEVVAKISAETGIDFLKVSDGDKCGGQKILALDAYGASYRSLGRAKIEEIITAFKTAKFVFPELASLTIDDDDGNFQGVVLHDHN
jgi:hypothetical protein